MNRKIIICGASYQLPVNKNKFCRPKTQFWAYYVLYSEYFISYIFINYLSAYKRNLPLCSTTMFSAVSVREIVSTVFNVALWKA